MVKTCLTYDAARSPRLFDETVGSHRFYELGYPLPVTEVQIGHDADHVMDGGLVHARMHVNSQHSLASNLRAVIFAFQFDHLILRATINLADVVLAENETQLGLGLPNDSPYYERIWPPQGPFDWPSTKALKPRGTGGTTSDA